MSPKKFISGGSSQGLAGLSGDSDVLNRTWYLTSTEVIPAEDMVQVRDGIVYFFFLTALGSGRLEFKVVASQLLLLIRILLLNSLFELTL